jgi:hypothetical protein
MIELLVCLYATTAFVVFAPFVLDHQPVPWAEPLRALVFLLFCAIDAVEFQALIRSIGRLLTGRRVEWQRWRRQSVFGAARSSGAATRAA